VTERARHHHDLPAPLAVPDPSRLDPARPDYEVILAAHGRALETGNDGYLDPATGFWCFTAAYLWTRSTCCNSGCRHCPYVNQLNRLDPGLPQDPRSG
jgi:hypothetical protein